MQNCDDYIINIKPIKSINIPIGSVGLKIFRSITELIENNIK